MGRMDLETFITTWHFNFMLNLMENNWNFYFIYHFVLYNFSSSLVSFLIFMKLIHSGFSFKLFYHKPFGKHCPKVILFVPRWCWQLNEAGQLIVANEIKILIFKMLCNLQDTPFYKIQIIFLCSYTLCEFGRIYMWSKFTPLVNDRICHLVFVEDQP